MAFDKEDNMLFEKRLHSTKGDAYVYDSIYRATGVKYGVPNAELNPATPWANYTYDNKEEFTLDGANNWVDRTYNGSTTSYTSNILNQYTQINSTTLIYDYNGNLKDDGIYLYFYDYANRLMQVKRKSDNVTIVDYQYDALGRRIEKANYLTAVTIDYYHDGARVIEERNASDTVLATYTHGNGIDEILTMERNSQIYYYHENVQGSIYAVTNSSGNIVEKYEYTAYGKVTIKDGSGNTLSDSAIGNYYTYTGREYDIEVGLYYYRARNYSPELGRFLQRDPMADDGLLNLYAYVENSPLNFTDPFGTDKGEKQKNDREDFILPYCPLDPHSPPLGIKTDYTLNDTSFSTKGLEKIVESVMVTAAEIKDRVKWLWDFGTHFTKSFYGLTLEGIDNFLRLKHDVVISKDWVFESGSPTRIYGPNDLQTKDMMRAPGIKAARRRYWRTREAIPWTHVPLSFFPDFFTTLFRPTLRQVGGYWYRFTPQADGSVRITVTNELTMDSFFFHLLGRFGIKERKAPLSIKIPFFGTVLFHFHLWVRCGKLSSG